MVVIYLRERVVRPLLLICPFLNESRNIGRLVESLNKQSSRNFSVLFVDGGSTDGTIEVLMSLEKNFSSETLRFDSNMGSYSNWARALEAALDRHEFDFAGFVAADDSICENYVSATSASIGSVNSQAHVPTFEIELEDSMIVSLGGSNGYSIEGLLQNWALTTIEYSVLSRSFLQEKYLPLLKSAVTMSCEWWIAYSIISELNPVWVPQARYRKTLKTDREGGSYDSTYYRGIAMKTESEFHRLNGDLLEPIRKTLRIYASSSYLKDELGFLPYLFLGLRFIFIGYGFLIRRLVGSRPWL